VPTNSAARLPSTKRRSLSIALLTYLVAKASGALPNNSNCTLEPDTRRVVRIHKFLCGDKGNDCQYNNAGFRDSLRMVGRSRATRVKGKGTTSVEPSANEYVKKCTDRGGDISNESASAAYVALGSSIIVKGGGGNSNNSQKRK